MTPLELTPADLAAIREELTASNGEQVVTRRSPPFDALDEAELEWLLSKNRQPPDAVPTGFPTWNAVCGDAGGRQGLARGWHIIVAGRTGLGKTILMENLARAAVMAGERVGFISMEMAKQQLETRYLAVASGLPVHELEQGPGFKRETFERAARAIDEQGRQTGGVLLINRNRIHKLSDVLDAMSALHKMDGVRYFLLDYLQLAGDPNDPASITAISHAVRQLTADLNVTTVAASQLNRETSKLSEQPTPWGLMGGSALENDCDQVVLLDHSRVSRAPAPVGSWHSYLLVAKNRHGRLVDVAMEFNAATLRMRERLPDELAAEGKELR